MAYSGEYISEAPLTDAQTSDAHDAIVRLLQAGGVDTSQVSGLCMVFRIRGTPDRPLGSFGYAGNLMDEPELLAHFLVLAAQQLIEGVRDEAVAALVPDDVSEIDGL